MKNKFKIGDWVCRKNNNFHNGEIVKINKKGIIFVKLYASLGGILYLGIVEFKPNELIKK